MDNTKTTGVEKPKRELTEAQRLAFMAGREKRMANILKKKAEKEEAKEMDLDVDSKVTQVVLPDPPIPKLKIRVRKTTDHPEPTKKEVDVHLEREVETQPEEIVEGTKEKSASYEIDPDLIADRVIAKLQAMNEIQPPSPRPRKKYTKKAKLEDPTPSRSESSLQERDLNQSTPPRQTPPRLSYNWC